MSEIPNTSVNEGKSDDSSKVFDKSSEAATTSEECKEGLIVQKDTKSQEETLNASVNNENDTNLDESCVYITDLVKEQEENEMEAMVVLGGSDENNCTYSKVSSFLKVFSSARRKIFRFSGLH